MALLLSMGCFNDVGESDCPAGAPECGCSDGRCVAGYDCIAGVCRRPGEETGTSTEQATMAETTAGVATDSSTTTDDTGPGSNATSSTADASESSSSSGNSNGEYCGCGWIEGLFYECGEDLPEAGPPGDGQPFCPEGTTDLAPCDSVVPAIDISGCCIPDVGVARCQASAIRIDACIFIEGICRADV